LPKVIILVQINTSPLYRPLFAQAKCAQEWFDVLNDPTLALVLWRASRHWVKSGSANLILNNSSMAVECNGGSENDIKW